MSNKKQHIDEEIKTCKCGDECDCTEEKNCGCIDEEIECECNKEEDSCDCEEDSKEKECGKKKDKKGFFKKNDKEIEELNQKIASLQEMLLRNQAELQNYKRRKDEEVERILKYKDEDLIKEYLPIIDNFERAIKMDDNDLSDEVSKFLVGFKIIYTNTLSMLNKFQVKEIDAEGLEFDPEYHHAVLTEHDDNKPEGVILEVLQKGYMYKDRVIRPAMVKVNE